MRDVARRPDVRGGAPTRGFRPGTAQALAALVLGLLAGTTGLQRGQWPYALLFFAVAGLGALGLWRAYRRAPR